MGCTHYPVLADAISCVLGEKVTLINAGTALSVAVKNYLFDKNLLNDGKSNGKIKFFVSDKPNSFRQQASILLGQDIDDSCVEQVDLGSL